MMCRWVQREIHNFGGDPAKVAIFGQSSGAEGVELMTVLPESEGLFRGAISQSGGLDARPLKEALNATLQLGLRVGCTEENLYACLRSAAADKVIKLQDQNAVGPVVDGILVPEDPMRLLADGKQLDVAILWGCNTNDSNLDVQMECVAHRGRLATCLAVERSMR